MIAIGVGNRTFDYELRKVSEIQYQPEKSRYFKVETFTDLRTVRTQLRDLIWTGKIYSRFSLCN